MPSLDCGVSPGATYRMKNRVTILRPFFLVLANAADVRSLASLGNPKPTHTPLLRRNLRSQTFASPRSSSAYHFLAALGRHPGPKPMFPLAAQVMGLVCSLYHNCLPALQNKA